LKLHLIALYADVKEPAAELVRGGLRLAAFSSPAAKFRKRFGKFSGVWA